MPPPMMTRWLRRQVPSVLLFAALLLAWQLAVSAFRVREYLLPGPLTVLRAAFDFRIPWWTHIWITGVEIVGAFLVAGVVGVLLGAAIFFFQAEDGIRDGRVTGVQTCALPI